MARRNQAVSKGEHPERFQPHLFTFYEKFPWRYIDNLPVEWSHLICKCDRFNYVTYYDNPFKQPPLCGNCGRAPITHFFKCGDCGTFYIRNFVHPMHCNYDNQRCWDCCKEAESLMESYCCDSQRYRAQSMPDVIREPRGVFQPAKKYDAEELYKVADFVL